MSKRGGRIFEGVATALITPFRKGEIDEDALRGLIERQLDANVSAILVAGTTGESATLTLKEHHRLVALAKEQIGGRVPLLAGCGSNSTARAILLAESARDAGADALLAVTPYYNKASDRGLVLHYQAIADATPLPLILYNVPSRTGFHITMEMYRALATHPRIVGVKEASGDLDLLEQLCAECGEEVDVFTGNDAQLVSAMKLGAVGVISVYSNLYPERMIALYRLCADGEWHAAEELRRKALPQMNALFYEVNPIPVKYLASRMGLCEPEYRLPLCPPSDATVKRLETVFWES
ncbi:MAG: 4-hydroxy-tetrahydrodipicolinate synthase [Clostridia bacterium]|nr:4-hydroxy-tetrahydrodipicolinate synthase [Clostridia bacterium]